MKFTHTISTVLFAGLLSVTLPACAFGWGDRGEKRVEHISEKLDLNEEQITQLEALLHLTEESREARHEARKDLMEEQEDAAEAFWQRSSLSVEEVSAFYSDRAQMMQGMMQPDARVSQALVDFHATLNADQREEFGELMSHPRWLMGGGRGHKRHGRY